MVARPYIVTPGEPVLTLAELRSQCRVDFNDDDSDLEAKGLAAEAEFQESAGYVLTESTWRQHFEGWPCRYFELDRYPVQSIASISYERADGTTGTVSGSAYRLITATRKPRVQLKYAQIWPSEQLQEGLPITVEFVAGNVAAISVPRDIRAALLVRAAGLYVDRDGMTEISSRNPTVGTDRVWKKAVLDYRIEA